MKNKEKRNITKLPTVPLLTISSIRQLTELCFRTDCIVQADIIFVFGTSIAIDETVEALVQILKHGIAKKVIITGGIPNYEGSPELSESESLTIYNQTLPQVSKDIIFFLEEESNNTLENVLNAKTKLRNTKFEKMLFICRSFTAGRCFLTLSKYFERVKLFQSTYDMPSVNNSKIIKRDNWYTFEEGRQRVWGEFLRIRKYGKQDDIEYSHVKNNVELLEMEFNLF